MLVGQSRKNTIIKLVDSALGFGSAFSKPVVSFSKFDLGTIFNNMPATMQFRNFTINTGTGNPGAIGVDFYGANVAHLDNIKVVGDGKIGVHIRIGSAHGYYNCHTSLIMNSNGPNRNWSPMIIDVQGSESKIWQMNHFPNRGWDGNIVIPVYSSYNPAIIPIQENIPVTGSTVTPGEH